ncbi:MAG: response regulator [Desulfuromusa sp.]|nr:response regulator [Desulfuromusa sp.]
MKYFNFGSIRKNLTFLVLLSVLPALIILLYTGIEQRSYTIEKAKDNILLLSHAMARTQENITNTARQTLSTLALLPEIQNLDLQTSRKILTAVLEKNSNYKNIALTDLKGDVLVSGIPSVPINLADRKHFKEALIQKDFVIGEYIVSRVGTIAPAFPFAYPVFDDQGRVKAVLTLIIKLTRFSDFFEISNLPKNSFIAVTDYNGVRLFYYPSKEKSNPVGKPIRGKSWEIASSAQTPDTFVGEGSDGVRRMFAFEPMRITPESPPYLYMWVGIPESQILGPANAIQTRNVLLMLLAAVLALLISWYIGKKTLISPLKGLVSLTQKFASGDLDTCNEQVVRNDEVGTLNQAFHEMADSLNQSQKGLRESQERFKKLSDLTFEGILIHNMGIATDVNESLAKMFGYSKEELIGKNLIELLVPHKYHQVINENIVKPASNPYEVEGRKKNGTLFPVEIESRIITGEKENYRVTAFRDITESKRIEEERFKLEEQMVQTQKLESLGVLAGGIAHDFNNLLAAIMGHAELTRRRLPPESAAIENLKQIELASERAADLAKQMLAYSGKGKFVTETINLNNLLEEMIHMLEVSISKNVVLRLDPYASLPAINADATQIRQILMNLVINASEAIGKKSGIISISTGCMDCDKNYLKNVWLEENLTDGLYVYLEVADTGCGMDKETLSKLFDPFFTTKFTGRGLGMSAVMGIVRGHKGALKVYSEIGKGTTFKILLPASDKPAEVFNGELHADTWVGTGKVLLVDDEESVRGIGVEMLKELGFDPLTANDGKEALEVFKNNADITLVILDLTMPKMGGEQCYRELKLLNPDVRVIVSSGYNEYEVSQKFIGKGIAGFVQKPYKFSTLKEAIKNIF